MERKLIVLFQGKESCCGCGACSQICPQGCISMQEDEEGFLYPLVNQNQCVQCGLCLSVCPFHNPREEVEPKSAFAAIAEDEQIRKESSSGGVFSLIARQILDEGGVVFGAMFDNQWNVVHGSIESVEDIGKLRGSKYVQSVIRNSFVLVKEFLENGRSVLFSGTPCQIAGLKHFLGKEYEKLLTVDVVCHGTPSPKVWRWYLKKLEKDQHLSISTISFRNKDNGWLRYNMVVGFSDSGIIEKKSFYHRDNPYMIAFLDNLSIRPSCNMCKAKSGSSHSDITLADFWNVDKMLEGIDDDRGVSLVMANTTKGLVALKSLKNGSFQSVDFKQAIQYNQAWGVSCPKNPNRDRFFDSYMRHERDFEHFVKMEPKQSMAKLLKKKLKQLLNRRKR